MAFNIVDTSCLVLGPAAMAQEARYLHICEALQHQIGALPQNSPLPSEHDLARRFGVSRVTIRRALGLLERSGSSPASADAARP